MFASPCDNLDGYLDDTLGDGKRQDFEAHLAFCVDCQREVQLQQQIVSRLASAAQLEPVPRSLIDTIEQRIDATTRRHWFNQIGIASAATIILAIGAWVGWHAIPGQKPVPFVTQNRPDRVPSMPTDLSHHQEPQYSAAADVIVRRASDGIVVPLQSEDSKVAIFWIYPSIPASPNSLQN